MDEHYTADALFRTGHNDFIQLKDIPNALLSYYSRMETQYDTACQIIVGTDSQNTTDTKFVSVIAAVTEGRGGIFFYSVSHRKRIFDVRTKLREETNDSLLLADYLIQVFENDPLYNELYKNCPISIHVDAGNSDKGKTKMLIPELIGWVTACGFAAQVKPESFVASTIADRISK